MNSGMGGKGLSETCTADVMKHNCWNCTWQAVQTD